MEAFAIIVGAVATAIAVLAYLDQRLAARNLYAEIGSLRNALAGIITPEHEITKNRVEKIRRAIMDVLTLNRNRRNGFVSWAPNDILDRVREKVERITTTELFNQLRLMVLEKKIAETAGGKPVEENRYQVRRKDGERYLSQLNRRHELIPT